MEKNKFHILVVDDDDKIRSLIKQYLVEKFALVIVCILCASLVLKKWQPSKHVGVKRVMKKNLSRVESS